MTEPDSPPRGNRRLVFVVLAGIAVMMLGTLAAVAWVGWQLLPEPAPPLSVVESRITLATDGPGLAEVERRTGLEVWLRVKLANAPVGRTLALICRWRDPTGKEVHVNRFTTREITRPDWDTHARFSLPADAVPGEWTAELALGGEVLVKTGFHVVETRKQAPP